MRFIFMSLTLCTGLFWIFTSCVKKSKNQLPLDKTFRYSISTEPPTLDWSKAQDTTSNILINSVMEGLVQYDFSKENISHKPGLARSYESKNGGQTWIFRLREDVYWTDGVPFSGQHIIDSWERVLNPKTGSVYAYFLFHIKNAKEYHTGLIKDFSKVGVQLTPKGNIRVELTGKKHFFPYLLTHSTTFPIRKDIVDKYKSKWTHPKNIVTLGPYVLDLWEHDKRIILKKNTSYYRKISGNVENVIIKIIPELSTVLNLFDSNQLDVMDELPSKQLAYFKTRPDFVSRNRMTTYYIGFNTSKPPLNSPLVRKAIAAAVDRRAIAKIMNNSAAPLSSWIPKGLFGFNPDIGLKFDPQKAKALLSQAASPLPKITLSFNTNENHKRIAENIQAQLKKNLGLNIELANEEWKIYLDSLRLGKMMMYRMGWFPDYPDPHNFMNLMTSDSENNHTRWKNKAYDQLVQKASVLPDGSQRKKLYDQAQRILTEQDTAVFPVFYNKAVLLLSKRVQFYPDNIMQRIVFQDIVLH